MSSTWTMQVDFNLVEINQFLRCWLLCFLSILSKQKPKYCVVYCTLSCDDKFEQHKNNKRNLPRVFVDVSVRIVRIILYAIAVHAFHPCFVQIQTNSWDFLTFECVCFNTVCTSENKYVCLTCALNSKHIFYLVKNYQIISNDCYTRFCLSNFEKLLEV